MSTDKNPKWINWTTRLQAIAQTGLTFATDPYDIERYKAIRELAVEMLAAGSDLNLPVIRNLFSADFGYATPKVDVRGVIFREDKILLVKEKSDGKWTLPGGWADVGETPAANVIREVLEETGFHVRATKILALFDRTLHQHEPPFPFHVYKLFVRCEIIGGQATTSDETDAIEFFGKHAIPELSDTRIKRHQIDCMFAHRHDPQRPTDFDVT
ncbi:MAG: NUDIX hydrolase [Verrucomicrobiota bacterium]